MSEQKKVNILADVLGRHYVSGEEHIFKCGFCNHHKKKLSVNIPKNKYKCWICDTRGRNIRRIVRRFGNFTQLKERQKHSDNHVIAFKKDDPNILYKTLQFTFDKLINGKYIVLPFSEKFEFDNEPISVYTIKKFDSYKYEVINEV